MNKNVSGALVLYILGVLYMFYALALICDTFFVPSLEVMIEKFDISQVRKYLVRLLIPIIDHRPSPNLAFLKIIRGCVFFHF